MYDQIKEIRNVRSVAVCHVLLYLLTSAYAVMAYAMQTKGLTLARTAVVVGVFLLMLFVEYVCLAKIKQKNEKSSRVSFFYHMARMFAVLICYVTAVRVVNGIVFLVLVLLFAIEGLYYIPFGDLFSRVIYYLCFSGIFISVSLVARLLQSTTLQNFLNELQMDVVTFLAVVSVCEVFARMWNIFEKKLFAQNRLVEQLNRVNEDLKEHQNKIKKINDRLGVPKIELQAANAEINRSYDGIALQNDVSSILISNVNEKEMLDQVAAMLRQRLDLELVMLIVEPDLSFAVPGEEKSERCFSLVSQLGKQFEKDMAALILQSDLSEFMSASDMYVQNTQAQAAPFFQKLCDTYRISSLLCLPVVHQEEWLGTLLLGKKKERFFCDNTVFYKTLAGQLSIGISNTRLYAKMNEMAIRDGLTGIFNRGHLSQLLDEYVEKAKEEASPLGMALFDIDKFKSINDTYGHQCGDAVIRFVAGLLNRGAIAHGGIAGRYGGEEFVVAFPEKGFEDVFSIITGLHEQIRSSAVNWEQCEIPVRASVGVSHYPKTCQNPEELLARADRSMYDSKQNGRDRITVDGNLSV